MNFLRNKDLLGVDKTKFNLVLVNGLPSKNGRINACMHSMRKVK
jgi:hypothetical protein